MNIYAISSEGTVRQTYRAKWPYLEFFHGRAGGVVNRFGIKPYRPLPLLRNLRLTPAVFCADGACLIVNEAVAQQIALFDSIDLVECAWEKVYDYPVDEQAVEKLCRQFSRLDEGFADWLEERYRMTPAEIPNACYHEVLAPRFEEKRNSFQCDILMELPSPPDIDAGMMTSAEMHRVYPVVRYPPYYLCIEEVYQVLRPYVGDPELFGVHTVTVD